MFKILLFSLLSAPEYQNVDGIWTTDFVKAYLPSSYDVVTLLIDGRGSAYEGDKFMHATYKKLGYIEPFDQIEVTQAVIKQNKFIDPERVGIYGWSYGGYMTSHTLGRNAVLNAEVLLVSFIILSKSKPSVKGRWEHI